MTVATLVQPVFTSQDAATYKAAIDASINVVGNTAGAFAPHEAATPAMTIVVDAGSVQFGITPVAKTAQTSGTITAPSVNPRINRAVIDSITGVLSIITGAEAASPVAPALTAGKIAIGQIALAISTTTITNSLITDERNSSYIGIIDEDTMVSDSAVLAPSQQSVKAYVDTKSASLNTKILDIGDWNMDTTVTRIIAHGLTLANIRSIKATIRNDGNTGYSDFAAEWSNSETTGININADATNVELRRADSGSYDSTGFDSTSYNRGWIIIQYID